MPPPPTPNWLVAKASHLVAKASHSSPLLAARCADVDLGTVDTSLPDSGQQARQGQQMAHIAYLRVASYVATST